LGRLFHSPGFVLLALFLSYLSGCAAQSLNLPTVKDEKLELFVAREARKILRVSENAHREASYEFRLVNFRRHDILGLSIGKQQIFLSYELARLAYEKASHRWLLRQTLAHEIAHDVLGRKQEKQKSLLRAAPGLANSITGRELGLVGNVNFRSYSQVAELEADRKGMRYWQKLGWDCRIWVGILRDFLDQGYAGDVDHPTQERLNQAVQVCHGKPARTPSPNE
jgi:predicted Zn-dependent protease